MFKKLFFLVCILAHTKAFSVTKGDIPSNSTNSSDMTLQRSTDESVGKVRIGLKLSPYAKVNIQNQQGKSNISFRPTKEIRRTLRARVDKPNHFVIGDFHVETLPLKWIKQTMSYTVRLVFSKRYGAYGEIEEQIGSLDLQGKLRGENGLFVLHGASTKTLKTTQGDPLLKVVAGYGKAIKESPAISTAPTKQKAEATPSNEPTKKYSSFKPRKKSTRPYNK